MRHRPSFDTLLGGMLLSALVLRVAYVLLQPRGDPAFARPMLDGALYLDWARALAAGQGSPPGAFYLAPLYPLMLWGFLELFGDDIAWLYLLQHVGVVGTAWLAALATRRFSGEREALAAAALLLLYHPLLYFASRPVGESLSLLLLFGALFLLGGSRVTASAGAGVSAGLASLARPNLLLVVFVWFAGGVHQRRFGRSLAIAIGAALVILPVTLRNWVVSGHAVAISANGGMTLYHGNGPGAEGIGTLPAELSGRVETQREEATRVAARRSGKDLDAVEADRWWGRQAWRTRLDDPKGTARLVFRRAALLLSNAELGLDYAPRLDANPLRWAAPIPFGVIVALAAVGAGLRGFKGSGGGSVWGAIAACAAVPLLFYASSRYRLPCAALLCLPAGVGAAALLRTTGRRRVLAGLGGAAVVLASLALPVAQLQARGDAIGLANRATLWRAEGQPDRAWSDLERALRLDPRSAPALYALGKLSEDGGDLPRAEDFHRRALALDPAHAGAASSLAWLQMQAGRSAEAVPLLRTALKYRPDHRGCWTNLVGALYLSGDVTRGRAAIREAAAVGVKLDPDYLRELESMAVEDGETANDAEER